MAHPPTPRRPSPTVTRKQKGLISRREFLALLGMGSALGATGGLGLGYLLLSPSPNGSDAASLPTPTPDPTRAALLKSAELPPIIARADWGARSSNTSAENENGIYSLANPQGWRIYSEDLRLIYTTVVIHHSSLYEDDDRVTMQAMQRLHMDRRGWADIGYHFAVGKSGDIYEGRPFTVRGTHTEGHNTGSLGICLMGNFQDESPTSAQLEATQKLVNWIVLRLDITHLAGHRDFNNQTVCPGANLYPLLDGMATQAILKRGIDGYVAPPEQLITPTPDPASVTRACSCGCCDDLGANTL